jgi:hypothetical protein
MSTSEFGVGKRPAKLFVINKPLLQKLLSGRQQAAVRCLIKQEMAEKAMPA